MFFAPDGRRMRGWASVRQWRDNRDGVDDDDEDNEMNEDTEDDGDEDDDDEPRCCIPPSELTRAMPSSPGSVAWTIE